MPEMTTTSLSATPFPAAATTTSTSSWRIFRLEVRNELWKTLRMPAYLLPTMLFPVIFYLFFGVVFTKDDGHAATYLLATYGTFGLLGATFFGLGIGLAIERGQGWLLLKRATPMRPQLHFAGRILVSTAIGMVVILLLFVAGAATRVDLPASTWLRLFAVLSCCSVPFSAIGLSLGQWLGPNSAPAVINLVYMPISFASGLWVPIHALPQWLQKIAQFLPPYHASQLALRVLEMEQELTAWPSIFALALTTAIFLAIAQAGMRRDRGQTYG